MRRIRKRIAVLIGVAVVLALAGYSIAYRYEASIQKSQESVLKENLRRVRETITLYQDVRGHYPADLEALVEHKFLRDLPRDPITKRNDTWILISEVDENGFSGTGIQDIVSGAEGTALDGSRYSDW